MVKKFFQQSEKKIIGLKKFCQAYEKLVWEVYFRIPI
jgi:hypothetical protein